MTAGGSRNAPPSPTCVPRAQNALMSAINAFREQAADRHWAANGMVRVRRETGRR